MRPSTKQLPKPDLKVRFYRSAWRWFCRTGMSADHLVCAHSRPEGHYSPVEAGKLARIHYAIEHAGHLSDCAYGHGYFELDCTCNDYSPEI